MTPPRTLLQRAGLALLGLALVVAACADADPYDSLSPAELAYVIPDSARWGPGNPCANADCEGPVTRRGLRVGTWIAIAAVIADEGGLGGSTTIRVDLVLRDGEERSAEIWGQDAEWATEALAAGHDLWAAIECGSIVAEVVCHLVAFDDHGRFAGIGIGAGLLFSAPLARRAAERDAASGLRYMEQLLGISLDA